MTCLNLKCTVCQSTKHVMGSMWEVVWVLRHRWQNYQQQHPLYNLIWLPIFHHTHPQSPRQPPQAILSQTWNSLSHHNLKTRSAVAWHCMGKYKDYSSVRLSLTFNGWPRAFLTVSQIYIFILRHAWVAIKLNKLPWIGLIFWGKVCLGSVRSKSYSAAEVLPVKRAIVSFPALAFETPNRSGESFSVADFPETVQNHVYSTGFTLFILQVAIWCEQVCKHKTKETKSHQV